jgi:hypothetical protein
MLLAHMVGLMSGGGGGAPVMSLEWGAGNAFEWGSGNFLTWG